MVPARGKAFGKLDVQDLVGVFNTTVKGLRAKTEVWCRKVETLSLTSIKATVSPEVECLAADPRYSLTLTKS